MDAYFWDVGAKGVEPLPLVDTVVSLTGFALVGGPARQDHPKAIDSLKRLNRPYMVSLPLVFQTTEEWEDSELGLHPIQVALQIAIPELDGAESSRLLCRVAMVRLGRRSHCKTG